MNKKVSALQATLESRALSRTRFAHWGASTGYGVLAIWSERSSVVCKSLLKLHSTQLSIKDRGRMQLSAVFTRKVGEGWVYPLGTETEDPASAQMIGERKLWTRSAQPAVYSVGKEKSSQLRDIQNFKKCHKCKQDIYLFI